ncbi:vWA domain-containing protein [Mucisphaera calidilacus]|uniref:Uncharacterized protein n=1 Tax=Mucisphaera calidilacus TaxID=2527982 RepID=A0A518BUV3_9BACT|nr:VWA domain-containing protein [Mucisphaera calidilacus]QDU70714.1 hypothetical protein Pan265_05460 [Mucisphaera calidilacus]
MAERSVPSTGEIWLVIQPWLVSVAVHALLAVSLVFLIQIGPAGVAGVEVVEPEEAPVVTLSAAPAPLDAPPVAMDLAQDLGLAPADGMALALVPGPVPGSVTAPGLSAGAVSSPTLDSAALLATVDPGAASFFGIAARSSRVAYVVDASGSSAADLPQILGELRNAVAGLDASQRFTVLIFSRGGVVEAPPDGLKPADPGTISSVRAWLRIDGGVVRPGGRSDPIPAFERALSLEVEEILFLSDGLSGSIGSDQILERVAAANRGRATIHTIHLRPDADEEGPDSIMARIAAAHGGTYRVVKPPPEPLF